MRTPTQALNLDADISEANGGARSPFSISSIAPLSATIVETTDAAASTSTAYSIGDDDVFQGSIDFANDEDWIEITLDAGSHLILVQDAVSIGTYNTVLALYDSTGTLIANEAYYDSDESSLTYYNNTASQQTVYASATAFNSTTGDYTVTAHIQDYGEGSYDEIVEYLTNGWIGTTMAWNVSPGGTIYYDHSDLDADEKILAETALEAWTFVTGINFVYSTTQTGMTFVNDNNGDDTSLFAFAGPDSISNNTINGATIKISSAWVDLYGTGLDQYSFLTYMHEIGHALGLDHGGPYNGTATYSTTPGGDNIFTNDSRLLTIMSYFGLDEITGLISDDWLPVTPMIADILAAQELYGVAGNLRSGDTIYGFNSTAGGYYDTWTTFSNPFALTIIDDGGEDLLDFNLMTTDTFLDMTPGAISSVGGVTNNVVIFETTLIEDAILGSGHDEVIGNDARNSIDGGSGNDTIYGGFNRDSLVGNDGNDTLFGGDGYDYLYGGIGNDEISGDAGIDTIHGGTGDDSLYGGTSGDFIYGGDDNDMIDGGTGDDRLEGGSGNDSILGDSGNDTILGEAGNDEINGGINDDSIDGGIGMDTIMGGTGNDTINGGDDADSIIGNAGIDEIYGDDGSDTLRGSFGTDSIFGGVGSDSITGDGGDDVIYGGIGGDNIDGGANYDSLYGDAGNDSIFGAGGNDYIEGNDDLDTVDGGAGADTIYGGNGADTLIGNGRSDLIYGGADGDTIFGDGAIDTLYGDDGNDVIDGGAQRDLIYGGSDNDSIAGGVGDDTIFGDFGNDTLNGDGGIDRLDGGAGDDTLTGGSGADTFIFTDISTVVGSIGSDEITDFQDNVDTIQLDSDLWVGVQSVQDLLDNYATETGTDVVFDFGDGNIITVTGVVNESILLDDITIV